MAKPFAASVASFGCMDLLIVASIMAYGLISDRVKLAREIRAHRPRSIEILAKSKQCVTERA